MILVQIRNTYLRADGTAAKGVVYFTPRSVGTNSAANTTQPLTPVRAALSGTGAIAVYLQATDDPAVSPAGWTYIVTEKIQDTAVRTYDISVPAASVGAGIDLADIAPVDAASGTSTLYQPLDSDLSAIAALTTTAFGRSRLAEADAAAARTALGLGTAATSASTAFDAAGLAAAAQAASMPSTAVARFNAAPSANGTVTALNTGQAVTNFGNSPISVVTGKLQHSPAATPQQAGYMQLDLGARVRRVGATVAWQPNSTGAFAIVIPSAPWSNGVLPIAGIHLVMFGNGIWHCARWNNGETTYADYTTHGRYATVWDGVARPIDLWIDPETSTCTLFFPDGTSAIFTSSFIGSETGNYAIWELYETNGSVDVPATIGEIWADSYDTLNPSVGITKPDVTSLLAAKVPLTLYEGANATAADIAASGAIPAGCAYLETVIIGGSAGAGSGACVTAGTAGNGGGAGGSAGIWREMVPASAFSGVTTWQVTVGRRGVGGVSVSTASNGNPGTAGTLSKVVLGGMALQAFGGGASAGGTTGATQGATAGAGGPFASAGAAAGINGALGANGAGITATPGTPGSGAGGGVTTAGVATNGGAGGSNLLRGATGGTAGVAGGAAPGVGTDSVAAVITAATAGSPGPGVGGGAGSATGAAQAGATPIGYGVGGGGGGASVAPNPSGAGPNGVGGYVLLRAHFY